MNRLAELQSLLRFYDSNLRGNNAPNAYQVSTGFVGGGGENRPGLRWAQDMMGMAGHNRAAAPDFFADEESGGGNALAPYVRPDMRGAEPLAPRAPRELPMRISRKTPLSGRVDNYLARLIGRGAL